MTKRLLFSVLLFAVSVGTILPSLPGLIQHIEGIDLPAATLLGGYIAASYAFFQFLLGPAIGNLSDAIGRRPVFLACLFGCALDLLIMAIAPSVFWLFLGRAVSGGFGIVFGPANAILADTSDAENRAKSFALTGAAFGVGLIIGPIIGGLATEIGPRAPFLLGGAIAIFNFVFAWFAIQETLSPSSRRRFEVKRANPIGALLNLVHSSRLAGPAIALFIWLLSFGIYWSAWMFYAPLKFGWDGKMVGLSFGVLGLSVAIVQAGLMGRMVVRLGERNTAILGISIGLIVAAVMMTSSDGILAIIMIGFIGFLATVVPSILGMMSRRLPDNRQGELQGYLSSSTALANLLAPFIYNTSLTAAANQQINIVGLGLPFLLSALIALGAMVILIGVSIGPHHQANSARPYRR